ncbi:hypothetical protein DM02DRAFT_703420 [Periconia macrospinosa]|uniref:Arrestin-like N-terminal domain-containing protein n=1 Tax=Periconia macrospinosa TaxID=97972 RepID=A0A2V1EB77_9PLEO|nr:hypothetical protein DM02DRAFT_703420 [Periconia macrospinosa]
MQNRSNYPQRHLYIAVSTAQSHVYRSGDAVRGVVRVHPQTRPLRVNITFRGRMKCAITISHGQGSTTYKEKPDFFLHTLELFSSAARSYDITGLGVTQDDRVEIPFEFQFPERSELNPGSLWKKHRSTRFDSEAGGLLPPTYINNMRDSFIEYFLEAKLFSTHRVIPDYEVRCPLTFLPDTPPSILDSWPLAHTNRVLAMQNQRGIWIRTHRLHPDYDPDEGIPNRIKHRLTKHRTTTPFVNFKVDASYPEVLFPGDSIPLTLFLEYVERSKEIPDPPPIYLRHVRVTLRSIARACIPRSSRSDLHDKYTLTTELLNIHYTQGDGLLLFDGLQLCSKKIPIATTPTFQTYGISLEHVVDIQAWLECAKERVRKTLAPQGKLVIVSRPRNPGVERAVPEMRGEQPPALEDDAVPPPYEEQGKNV